MTDKVIKIVGAILIIFLLVGITWLFIAWRLQVGKYNKLNKLYSDCLNAPKDTIIIHIDTTIVNNDTIRPIGSVIANDHHKDSIIYLNRDTCAHKRYYSENYKKDGFMIHWEAQGNIDWIRFPQYTYPKEIQYITNTVTIRDTVPLYKDRSHIGLYTKLWINNFNEFPGVELGVMYSFKGRGGIMGGAAYFPNQTKNWYGTIGGFINLN